jgi:hypothetical protein
MAIANPSAARNRFSHIPQKHADTLLAVLASLMPSNGSLLNCRRWLSAVSRVPARISLKGWTLLANRDEISTTSRAKLRKSSQYASLSHLEISVLLLPADDPRNVPALINGQQIHEIQS